MTGSIGDVSVSKLIIILLILFSLFAGCSKRDTYATEKAVPSSEGSNSEQSAYPKRIQLSVSLEEEKKLQAQVDNGHQPWRLEPIDVAHATLLSLVDKNIDYKKCALITQAESGAMVRCEGTKTYLVHLKRMVRREGIWTATEIEITK